MREKRYSKDMKGTQGKEETIQRFLALKENLLFNGCHCGNRASN